MKPSAIFLCIVFLLAAVSCGKGKGKSVFPTSDVNMPRGLYLQGDSSDIVKPSFILYLVYLLFRFYLPFV